MAKSKEQLPADKAQPKPKATATPTPYGNGVTIKFITTTEIPTDNFTFKAGFLYEVSIESANRWVRRNCASIVDDRTDN